MGEINMDHFRNVIVNIDELPQAEMVFNYAEELIGPWLESAATGEPDTFFDQLAAGDDMDVSNSYVVSYNERCDQAANAIEKMFTSLSIAYHTQLKNSLEAMQVQSVRRVDRDSVVLCLVPRERQVGTYTGPFLVNIWQKRAV